VTYGTNSDEVGAALAIDGDLLAIGANKDNSAGALSGTVLLYRYDGAVWNLVQQLFAPSAQADDRFGSSVALRNGQVFVGATRENADRAGSVFVFAESSTDTWTLQQEIQQPNQGFRDGFGSSISLSGNQMAVGNDGASFWQGAFVFELDGADVWQPTASIDTSSGDDVAIEGDRLIVEDLDGGCCHAAFLYEPDGSGGWERTGKLVDQGGVSDTRFGDIALVNGEAFFTKGTFFDVYSEGSLFVFPLGAPPPNQAPSATDDVAQTDSGQPVTIDVLANDSDPDGDVLSVSGTTSPSHGTVTIDAGGLTYTPGEGFTGQDTFQYTVEDGRGSSASATVTVTVHLGESVGFSLALTLTDALGNDLTLVMGMVPGATEGFDNGLDIWAPPPPPSGAFDARLIGGNEDLAIDIRSPDVMPASWNVAFKPQTGHGPVQISWDPQEAPTDAPIVLSGGGSPAVDMAGAGVATLTDASAPVVITYGAPVEIDLVYDIGSDWNMLGVPFGQPTDHGQAFPTALPNTLFQFVGRYEAPASGLMAPGAGYWLRFGEATQTTLSGEPVSSIAIQMAEGWNMISGPNCSVPLTAISDPESILLDGTLFAFSGSYQARTGVDPTQGYWLRTSAAGTIALDCAAASKVTELDQPDYLSGALISDDSGASTRLLLAERAPQPGTFALPPPAPGQRWTASFPRDTYLAAERGVARIDGSPAELTLTAIGPSGLRATATGRPSGPVTFALAPGESAPLPSGVREILLVAASSDAGETPMQFTLEQNYPNPFNPSTNIHY
ncbi:MAG: cadherin-like domain-containing protein, partial [Rhodothermales bacterium]|nr:cadherin-like domain-containing protein [Rhodothermales bacterium]